MTKSVREAIENAEAANIITSWEEYTKLSPNFFKKHMNKAIVVDGRRIYDKTAFAKAGVIYRGIGL